VNASLRSPALQPGHLLPRRGERRLSARAGGLGRLGEAALDRRRGDLRLLGGPGAQARPVQTRKWRSASADRRCSEQPDLVPPRTVEFSWLGPRTV